MPAACPAGPCWGWGPGRSPPQGSLLPGVLPHHRGQRDSLPEASGAEGPASVGAPAVAVVGRLVGLGFLGDGAALAALPGAALPILLQVVVEDLRVRLLMWGQDVHEGGGGVRRRRCGVDGAATAQRRRQVEGGCWGSSVKSLLLEGLLSFGVDRARDVWHACITGCHGYTSAVPMRAIATGLLERGC